MARKKRSNKPASAGRRNAAEQQPSPADQADAAVDTSRGAVTDGGELKRINVGVIVVALLVAVLGTGIIYVFTQWLPLQEGGQTASSLVAEVNDEAITERDVDVELEVQKAAQAQKGGVLQDDEDVIRAVRRELLDSLVDQQLLLQAAQASGIEVLDEEIDGAIESLGEELTVDMSRLHDDVIAAGITEAEYGDWLRRGITVRRYLQTEEAKDLGLAYRRERGVATGDDIFVSVTMDDVAPMLQRQATIRFVSQEGADIQAASVGNPAPDFTVTDLEGRAVSLSDFRGQPVMINFWATWCKPCVLEMPMFVSAYERYKDEGFVVLAVNVQEPVADVEPFARERGLSMPVVLDEDGHVSTIYRVRGLPSTFFVDAQGILVEAKRGTLASHSELADLLQRIMPDGEAYFTGVDARAVGLLP